MSSYFQYGGGASSQAYAPLPDEIMSSPEKRQIRRASSMSFASPRETRFPEIDSGENKLRRQYSPTRQFFRLFFTFTVRFLINVAFCAVIVGMLRFYERKGVLSNDQKHWFNAANTGITIAFGLNLTSSFKDMAGMLRWRILANGPHSAQEIELILCLSSFSKATKLMYRWLFRRPRYYQAGFFTSLWVLLGLGAQISVALIGLNYSMDSDDTAIRENPGLVNVTDLKNFYPMGMPHKGADGPTNYAQRYTAHLYGELAASLPYDSFDHETAKRHEYYFDEKVAKSGDQFRYLSHKSNRSVIVNSECSWYPIIEGQEGSVDGITVDYDYGKNTSIREMEWLGGIRVTYSTLYINPMTNNKTLSCGPRCSRLFIVRYLSQTEITQSPMPFGDFYECTVNVTNVTNAMFPEHKMSDSFAKLAAGSIGFSGVLMAQAFNYEYNAYTNASLWGNWDDPRFKRGNGSEIAMSNLIGSFALSSISTADTENPPVEHLVMGMRPSIGVFLTVKWRYVLGILGLILVAHLILGVASVIISNSVFVKDDTYLATARLLRPLVDRLGVSGCAASGEDIAQASFPEQTLRYGVRKYMENGVQIHHLDIGEFKTPTTNFPKGLYDGGFR